MDRPLTPREALLSRLASYATERGLAQLDLPPAKPEAAINAMGAHEKAP